MKEPHATHVVAGRISRKVKTSGAKLTERECEIVDFVFWRRRVTARQIGLRYFGSTASSRLRHCMARLTRSGYVDRVPRKSVTAPYIYRVSGRSAAGLMFLRGRYGDATVRRRMAQLMQDEHLLLISECYVSFSMSATALAWRLVDWEDALDLRGRTGPFGLIPDAYFRIEKEGGNGSASFFVELERTAKSQTALTRKIELYERFYRDGSYTRLFGRRSLRVLFVLVSAARPRFDAAASLATAAGRLGATFVCATTAATLMETPPPGVLASPIWRRAGHSEPYSLLPGLP